MKDFCDFSSAGAYYKDSQIFFGFQPSIPQHLVVSLREYHKNFKIQMFTTNIFIKTQLFINSQTSRCL